MAKRKNSQTAKDNGTQSWWQAALKHGWKLIVGLGIIGTIQNRWEKHEALNEDLEEVILIIGKADHQSPNEDVEKGWWLPNQIDRKLAFIVQEQSGAHTELWNIQGLRFRSVDSLSSPLTTLRAASLAFHKIEKDSHPNEYTQYRAEAKWTIASAKAQEANPNGLAQLPIAMLATVPSISPPTSKSLASQPGTVEGMFVRHLPVAMDAGKYPVVNLKEPGAKKAMIEKNINPPEGSGYFIPSANGIQNLESVHGLHILPRN